MEFETKLLIDGALVEGDFNLDVVDPACGTPFVRVGRASEKQAHQAVAAAKRAQLKWAATPRAERQEMIIRFAEAINGNADALARALVQEQGKPLSEATLEVTYAEFFLRHFALAILPSEVIQDDATHRIEMHHKPLGVVAAIIPWNFPLLIACYKLGPALALGNTMVIKPAPTTPVTALMLGALAQDIFPPGVVNVLADDNDLGALLTSHPDVAKVSFTGSTATGRKVMGAAAATLKRITLELGGNDAAIVLPDVDIADIAPKLFGSAFLNAGQVCIAIKRIYAHDAIYEDLCAALAKLANESVVGNGLEQGVQIGPLQNLTQFQKAKAMMEVARKDGTIIAGGKLGENGGYFVHPTIVRDIEDGSQLVDEEQFMPILPIIRFSDVDTVAGKANHTQYGLGGSVWSADSAKAYRIAQTIESGTVWVNHHLHFGPNIPFAGAKQSGLGVEFSKAGLEEYSQISVISVAK